MKKHLTRTPVRKRHKVGILLIALTKLGKKHKPMAYLQKRGVWDCRRSKPQTWPGVCQVTAEGKQRESEPILTTLFREAMEELGFEAGKIIMNKISGGNLPRIIFQNDHATTFELLVPIDVIQVICLENVSGGLVPIQQNDVKKLIVAKESWRTNAHNKNGIVVSSETKAAIIKAFTGLPK